MKSTRWQILGVMMFVCASSWSPAPAWAAAPVARDDYVVATDRYLEVVGGVETYSILIDVLANDENTDGDPLNVNVQGGFGLPPEIWIPDPVGTVQYLGAGVFELRFGKEELGDATEVTFQYELEGAASLATVRVTVSGEGPPADVVARDDAFDEPWTCWIELDVLANDTGVDEIKGFTQPLNGEVRRHPAEPQRLVYRGGSGGTFTYTAGSSATGATSTATVTVEGGFLVAPWSTQGSFGEVVMADCFNREDGVALDGQVVGYFSGPGFPPTTWTASGLSHLDEAGTLEAPLPGGSAASRRAYLPFFTGPSGGSAFQIQGTFQASGDKAEWVALAFTHGNGSVFNNADLWVRLDVETGEIFLNGRWNGSDLAERLGAASPTADGYPFLPNGVNHLRLRYDSGPAVPRVDVWVNGNQALSVAFLDDQDNPVPAADVLGSIENVGFFIYYGQLASAPGDAWFDDFELRVGDVSGPVLVFKSDDPVAGVDVENGSTVSLDPLHLGCTADHVNCHTFRERSLFLRNDGNQDLEVSHLTFEGPTEWSISGPATDPFTIPAGGVEEIRVRVDALEVGATTSRLELSTNDPDLQKYVVHFAAEVTPAPVAEFVHYCDRLSCSFDGGSSTGVGLTGSGFVWLLDGGSPTSGPTRSHTFLTTGVHTVELRVTDATGAQHRLQRTVSVAPEAGFIYTCSHATRSCDFDGAATTDGVVSYRYQFGDGTLQEGLGHPGEVLLRHTYATSGRYDVSLTVTDGDGQEDTVTHEVTLLPIPDFAASCSPESLTCEFDASLASPQMVLYEWSFGDGTLGTGLQTAHTFATSGAYTVTLTVVDPSGQVEAIFKTVEVLPRAEFSLGCDPDTRSCDFDGSLSTAGVTHEWDFGDGSPAAIGPVQEHTYGTSGIFDVILTVTDGSGQTDTTSRSVVIPPRAAFTVSCDGLSCGFDATGSSPGAVSYAWDFGHDGATGTGVTATHAFPDESDYDVTLTITDASGQVATTTRTVAAFDEELFLLLLLDRR